MRNLTTREWMVVFAVLAVLSVLATVYDLRVLAYVTQVGWIALVAERAYLCGRTNAGKRPRTRTSVRLCNQNPLGDHGHGCVRRADDGHTMHRCAHGDCSWGY